ncbi:hypothetical protein WAE56_17640 [Iodobacter sp. LRB]|uniref:hypothetical protein n=1 Tax=unclassified Iodobacter TaxID=235634 RepID=UPI00117B16DB|nr:hypothetical protein [Iodobacter sp. BJB302]
MNPAYLTPIAVPFADETMKVTSLCWSDTEATQIVVASKRTGRSFVVEFQSVEGLRMLDELDLASVWINSASQALASTWLFKVNAGGWLELESTRDDFYTQHQENQPYEFLIGGYLECVSVLSLLPPVIQERT